MWGFVPLAIVEYYCEGSPSYREVFVGENQDVISSIVRFVIGVDVDNPLVVYDALIKEGYCALFEIYPCRSHAGLGRCGK